MVCVELLAAAAAVEASDDAHRTCRVGSGVRPLPTHSLLCIGRLKKGRTDHARAEKLHPVQPPSQRLARRRALAVEATAYAL